MIMQWISDFRHGWRALLRTPGFLVTSVVTLALAIGAVVGMFSVVNTVLLDPLPFPDSDRLVVVAGTAPGSDLPERFGLGQEFYLHYKERSQLLDGIFLFGAGTSTLRTEDRVERIPMAFPTNDMYATLGVRPQVGRLPVPEDADRVVLISDRLWSTWFGRDPAVVGKRYFVSGEMRQVIGVMPPEFSFPTEETLLWVAGEVRPSEIRPGQLGAPVIARMKPGVTREQLGVELTRLSKELPARFGGSPNYARIIEQHSAVVEPVLDRLVGPTASTSLWVLLGAVAVVLLIACANVANLFLVRAEGRRRSLAVRRAIGASRAQLVRLQMTEAFLVALLAGGLAVMLSALTLPLFLRAAPEGIPRLSLVRLDLSTLAAAFGLVVVAALACGAIPALHASSPDLGRLREGSRGSTGRRHLGRDVLVVGQTALALVLLIGSALLVQSFQRLRTVDPGYETADIYTFQFAPEQERLIDGPTWGRFHLDFMDRLRALPGVTAVGVVNNIPLDEGTGTGRFLTDSMAPEGGGALLDQNFAGGDYFRVMGIDLLRGRPFTPDEAVTPNSSVIISRSAAARLWPRSQSPRAAHPSHRRHAAVVHRCRRGGGREAGRLAGGRRGHRVLPADGTDADDVGDGIAGLRRQVAAGREPWPRGARTRAPGGAGSAGVPRVHDGVPGAAIDGPAVVHDADARRRLGAGDDSRRGRVVRRAVVRRRRADAGDRRTHGARRNRRRGAAHGGVAGGESGAGRRRLRRRRGAGLDAPAGGAAIRSRRVGTRRVRCDVDHDDRYRAAGELHARASREQRGCDRVAAK